MPKQQHQPWDIKTFNKGAQKDTDKEFLGASPKGEYIDSKNMRPTALDGDTGSIEKIGGESLKYELLNNGGCPIPPIAYTFNTSYPGAEYTCMVAVEINDNFVEIWADKNSIGPPIIRVNGIVVLKSFDFPIKTSCPIQVAKNENCVGGEIYITDYCVEPMLFNVKDMMDNSGQFGLGDCTNKYYLNFNPDNHKINLKRALDHPVLTEVFATGGTTLYNIPSAIVISEGGSSMPVGYYQYAIRYVTDEGDRTVWSVATPLIPIVEVLSTASTFYPSIRTISAPPNITLGSGYSIKIRFRLNNLSNYKNLEIKRISYNSGDPLGTTPNPVLIKTILDIDDTAIYGKPCVIDFIDNGAEAEEELAPDEETTVIGVINRAKAIRYYNNRLYLMNIEYSERNVEKADLGLVPASDGNYIIPQIQNLEKDGYNNTYNSTYYKGYERGERYSYAIVFHDDKGEKSFAVPIQDDYQFPNRRDEISSDTATLVSHFSKGDQSDLENLTVKCADSESSISRTHEVFDMTEAIHKDNLVNFNNVMVAGQRAASKIRDWEPYTDNVPYNLTLLNTVLTADDIGYKPLRPTGKLDPKVENFKVAGVYPPNTEPGKHEQVINPAASQDQNWLGTEDWIGINDGKPGYATGGDLYYKPEMYGPNNYALGGAINRITFPDWAVSSNIVRSRPARRVIAQGIGFYLLSGGDFSAATSLATKSLNKFCFYSPDIDGGFINAAEVLDIGDSGNYSVELVSPLGFGTELYSGKNQQSDLFGGRDRNVDMIHYCRVLYENGQINAGDYADSGAIPTGALGAQVGEQGYVQYGKWRNDNGVQTGGAFSDRSNIDTVTGTAKQFPITSFSSILDGRQSYFELTLGTWNGMNPYIRGNTYQSGKPTFAQANTKQFHEPIYIVNIIREENHIDSGNVDEYFETGQYLKKESLIEVWNNDNTETDNTQTIYLVDERWEDCIPNYYAPEAIRNLQQRFVYIKQGNTGVARKWINMTYLTSGGYSAIALDILNNNSALYGIHGFYMNTPTAPNDEGFYGLRFGELGTVGIHNIDTSIMYPLIPQAFMPLGGDYIYVNYDDTIPISFYGGDTFVGESMFCPLDRQGEHNASIPADTTQFQLGIPMPYHKMEVNPRIYIPNKVQNGGAFPIINRIQDEYTFFLDFIRQMAVMATVEQKLAIQYLYTNDSTDYNDPITNKIFSQVHYIMQPNEWDLGDTTPTGDSTGTTGDCKVFGTYFNTDYKEFVAADHDPVNDGWTWGGIRSPFQLTLCMNIDYSHDPNTMVEFTKPKVGFNEETLFCTRIIWSETREPNMVDSPGVKTFPSLNYFDISDDTGEIKHAYDATSEKGRNLYAFTNSGLCLLLTDKKEVVDAKVSSVALMSVSSQLGVQDQFWLSKTIGMSDEMWRSAADFNNAIYFANYNSVYKFSNNVLGDIGKLGYAVKIRESFLNNVGEGYTTPLSACYDIYNSEYWITFGDSVGANKQTFAYNDATKHWNGSYDYDHDKYISFKRVTYGMKWSDGTTGGTFELNKGFYMNSVIMEAHVSQACSPKQIMSKEFIRVRVASDKKPVQIDFSYTDGGVTLCSLAQSIQGTYYLKDYGAYEQYIPRAQSGNRYRVQGRLLIYKIIHNLDEHFEVVDVGVQYKLLK